MAAERARLGCVAGTRAADPGEASTQRGDDGDGGSRSPHLPASAPGFKGNGLVWIERWHPRHLVGTHAASGGPVGCSACAPLVPSGDSLREDGALGRPLGMVGAGGCPMAGAASSASAGKRKPHAGESSRWRLTLRRARRVVRARLARIVRPRPWRLRDRAVQQRILGRAHPLEQAVTHFAEDLLAGGVA